MDVSVSEANRRTVDEKREKISEIYKSMDYENRGNFSEAWEWLKSNLEWINAVLRDSKLEVKQGNFSMQEIPEKYQGNDSFDALPYDKWIQASNSLTSLFEKHSTLFGQLACLEMNWKLGFFMDSDVKYLKDYLNVLSISIQDPTLSLLEFRRDLSFISQTIDSVYHLPCFLFQCLIGTPQVLIVRKDFLLPALFFVKLASQAGFFQESLLSFISVKSTLSEMEEGIMLVFGDGDFDSAIDTLVDNYFYGPKQGIWLMKKVLVQETVYGNFIKRLLKQINSISLPPLLGHDNNGKEDSCKNIISDASSVGVKVYETYSKNGERGPIIFEGEPPSFDDLIQTDLRLPFIATQPFRTAEECISLANSSIHCSSASLWTESQSLAMKVHKHLKMKTVWLNAHGLMDPLVPVYCPKMNRDIFIKWNILSALKHLHLYFHRITEDDIQDDGIYSYQKMLKTSKEWQKVDLIQRAKILSDIAHNLRQRTDLDEAQHAADIFFYFAEECLRCSLSTSIVTKKGICQVSFEPIGSVRVALDESCNSFESLALLTAPLISYGNPLVIDIHEADNDKTKKCVEFQKILLSSGLPENLFNIAIVKMKPILHTIDHILCGIREQLLADAKYNRNSFNFVLRGLSYSASLPKVLWIPN